MASAGNNTFIEYITTPKDHFYLGPINNTLASAANVLVYNPLNNEISYTLITNTPLIAPDLQAVTTAGSSTNLTCAFTNPTTGLTTTSNISIGGIITCNTIVISPSFSQPSQILGTMVSPSSSPSQSYTSGVNKYIYYYNAYTNVDFLLSNLPVNFLANTTVNTSANWTLTGNPLNAPFLPVFTTSTSSINNTVTSSEIYVKIMFTTPPTITSGTGGFKLVITLTQDS